MARDEHQIAPGNLTASGSGRDARGANDQKTDLSSGPSISLMYREYCRARLAEMRKYHLAAIA